MAKTGTENHSPMLRRTVSTQPEFESHLLAILDAIDEPVSIATAIRDRDERILDFRLEFVNRAAADWAGVPREAMIGRITGELLPEFRASGFFDTLAAVVETGFPYHEAGAQVADAVTGGAWVGGIYDMRAIRLGDGYMSTWRRQAATPRPD
jgi:PAS domain-containing protein